MFEKFEVNGIDYRFQSDVLTARSVTAIVAKYANAQGDVRLEQMTEEDQDKILSIVSYKAPEGGYGKLSDQGKIKMHLDSDLVKDACVEYSVGILTHLTKIITATVERVASLFLLPPQSSPKTSQATGGAKSTRKAKAPKGGSLS